MKRILWLDDNENLIDSSIELFQEHGFQILKATTISRALTILRTEKLDGVLLDVRLQGGEDGLELLQEIHLRYPTLKVVIFTAYPDVMDHILAQRFGASFYLENYLGKIEKPIPPEQLSRFFAVLHRLFDDESESAEVSSEGIVVRPLSVFCSYSHRDARLRDKLEEHLSNLKRQGKISVWHDRDITGGEEWAGKIEEHLNTADIILLLVSASFMASDYCNSVEMRRALERHALEEARVIPVILRPVDWQSSPIGKLQALPTDGRAVSNWKDREEAFMNIAQGIRKVVQEMSQTE